MEKRKLLLSFVISVLVTCALIFTPPGIILLTVARDNIVGSVAGLGIFGVIWAIAYVIVSIFFGPGSKS